MNLPASLVLQDGTKYARANTTPKLLCRLRIWGDPILVQQGGLSVEIAGTTNFQAIGLFNKFTSWGGVSNFLNITPRADIDKLIALQVEDEYEDKQPDWRSQKMNWLCKSKGTIYFTGDEPGWRTATRIKWGTIALGNNIVQVDGFEEMFIQLRGETRKRWVTMARLVGFRKSDWGRPLNELLALGLVHRCYCAYSGNTLDDTPKGIIYSPFWSPLDWDFSGMTQPQAFYLPVDWMVPA
jgi:hypothetical protein